MSKEQRVTRVEFFKLCILFFLFAANLLIIFITIDIAPKSFLKISFLNVGQGDSILFQTPNGGKILVDGGRDKTVLGKLGMELPIYTKKIDLVIATHDDLDHIAGLIYVLKKYKVNVLMTSLLNTNSLLNQELMDTAKVQNTKIVQATTQTLVKTNDGLLIKIFFPITNMDGAESNDASIVSQFIFGNSKILLSGDLSQSGELFLIKKYGESLKSDILKLGHHGSDSSSNPEFIQKVAPTVAIVSAGKNNNYGHPHKSVLELLEKFEVKILRTDELGTINFYTNGLNVWR